jgi:cation diffusion facilitator CzcD-associated flavoprotein CzcO
LQTTNVVVVGGIITTELVTKEEYKFVYACTGTLTEPIVPALATRDMVPPPTPPDE